jgi:hypothetical protein
MWKEWRKIILVLSGLKRTWLALLLLLGFSIVPIWSLLSNGNKGHWCLFLVEELDLKSLWTISLCYPQMIWNGPKWHQQELPPPLGGATLLLTWTATTNISCLYLVVETKITYSMISSNSTCTALHGHSLHQQAHLHFHAIRIQQYRYTIDFSVIVLIS